LSDAQERKWYDDHRDAILKGGDGTNDESESFVVDLWPYFSPACCSGPLDCDTGFYAVYGELFVKLAESEITQKDEEISVANDVAPCFKDSVGTSSEVYAFYNYWTNFVTKMSFSWEDKYNPTDVPNRQVRRAIEKENKKFRDVARKKYNDTVRALASYIRKRDPRVMGFELEARARKMEEDRKKVEIKLDVESKRREKRELSRIALESNGEEVARRQQEREGAFLLADCGSDEDGDYDELAEGDLEDIKANADYLNLNPVPEENEEDEYDDENKDEVCEVCSKTFKTGAQLLQHLASKIHRKKVQEMEKKSKKSGGAKSAGKADSGKQSSNGKVKPVIVCPASDSDSENEGDIEDEKSSSKVMSETSSSAAKTKKSSTSKVNLNADAASVDSADGQETDSGDDGAVMKGKKGKKIAGTKKESIVDYATASLRSLNISGATNDTGGDDNALELSTTEKTKNKYKKKEKLGYFPRAIMKELTPVFDEDCLDPVLHEEGVDVAIMPGPQKKKTKKISLRGF
jgi:DnaJ homolog subfamily A member 5